MDVVGQKFTVCKISLTELHLFTKGEKRRATTRYCDNIKPPVLDGMLKFAPNCGTKHEKYIPFAISPSLACFCPAIE
jgi:hypothetical protein